MHVCLTHMKHIVINVPRWLTLVRFHRQRHCNLLYVGSIVWVFKKQWNIISALQNWPVDHTPWYSTILSHAKLSVYANLIIEAEGNLMLKCSVWNANKDYKLAHTCTLKSLCCELLKEAWCNKHLQSQGKDLKVHKRVKSLFAFRTLHFSIKKRYLKVHGHQPLPASILNWRGQGINRVAIKLT